MFFFFDNNHGRFSLTISGAIDSENSDRLDAAFSEVCNSGRDDVCLDLRKVTTINSSGIGKLVALRRNLMRETRHLQIMGISDNLYETFRLIKLDKLIPIHR